MDWAHLPWPGGLSDQPHQLMWELDCVEAAIDENTRLTELTQAAFTQGQSQIANAVAGIEDT